MTQEPGNGARRRRAPVDLAGTAYTERVAEAVKSLRGAKGWTHTDLAKQMTLAGVPWSRETAVNLERGRKRSLGVHELLALAFVLDVDSPVDLIAPGEEWLPVVGIRLLPADVRRWCLGETGPLRRWLAGKMTPESAPELTPKMALASVAELFETIYKDPRAAARTRQLAKLLDSPPEAPPRGGA